jgi:Spy/CpxP family protein refolding chaperone
MRHYPIALAALILSTFATAAMANDSNSVPTFTFKQQGSLAGQPQQMGKSREQVRQELLDAQRQGLIPNT